MGFCREFFAAVSKTLLIISGGQEAVEIARAVRETGHTVVVSDSDPEAPAFAYADSCLIADIHGADETAAAAERYNRKIRKIDGVLCAADAALTAAAVTARLRLPGQPLHVAELISDRLMIRRAFASAGIATPWHMEISTPQALQRVMIAKGSDLMVKPIENRGALGVTRLTGAENYAQAFQLALSHSPSERVMVEQWLDGDHSHVSAVMRGGQCHAAGSPQTLDLIARTASALGISDGPLVAEIVTHQDAHYVSEVSARLGSASLAADAARFALGE
jgi:biotin carboxylase